jgi:uncharacterized membrane protein YuzA (DUF378 family)
MKALGLVASILLVIGGLNWGLVGLFNVNLVVSIFGDGSFLSRLIYVVVGLAAVYMILDVTGVIKKKMGQ